LAEQFEAVRMRVDPVRRLLRRFQRAGAQVLQGLWPGVEVPRTPSRTADWLEAAAERLEAWKGAAARAGAKVALDFAKAWYPNINMAQLTTLRQEALPDLARESEAIAVRASALAEYADPAVFIPERDEEGREVPPSWFGINPALGEDSMEEIASSDEGEEEDEAGEEEDGDNGGAPDDGASSRSRPDPVPSGDQTATVQSAPSAGASATATSTAPPSPPPALDGLPFV
jgi:hypothetical protein